MIKTNRIQWTETVYCLGCGKMGKITLSRMEVAEGRDRVERGMSGFITETTESGFQFRCTDCRRIARLTKPN